jgi:hypothetical protein
LAALLGGGVAGVMVAGVDERLTLAEAERLAWLDTTGMLEGTAAEDATLMTELKADGRALDALEETALLELEKADADTKLGEAEVVGSSTADVDDSVTDSVVLAARMLSVSTAVVDSKVAVDSVTVTVSVTVVVRADLAVVVVSTSAPEDVVSKAVKDDAVVLRVVSSAEAVVADASPDHTLTQFW